MRGMHTLHRFSLLLDRHPLVFAHLVFASGALVLGAVVLWSRKGNTLHRSIGWTWVLLMTGATLSAAFIRDYQLPNVAGLTPIHLFVVLVAWKLPVGVMHARRGQVAAHRQAMRGLYLGGCLLAGVFTLLPGRFLGSLLWPRLALLVA